MTAWCNRQVATVVPRSVLLAVFAVAVASCATIDATTTQFVGAPHFRPSDPARVEILRGEPPRAHDRLGEIIVDVSTDPPPPIEKVEAKLRSEASKLGADAVVVVSDRVQAVGAYVFGPPRERGLETVKATRVIGVAIKYRP